jgi:hypothetical protein
MRHPPIKFLSSSLLGKKPLNDTWAEIPLPTSRPQASESVRRPWTYGRYFQVIKKGLSKDSFESLLGATQKRLGFPLSLPEVQEVFIYSEKHGNLYHPAKVEVVTGQGTVCFAVNVALTEEGREAMVGEVRALTHLLGKYPYPWLPAVYFYTTVESRESEDDTLSLFLADWFEGFHEFHLSFDSADNTRKLILWDGNPIPRYLSPRQAGELYHRISKILTLYYDPRTYEQIFPWHHGAGDFVVRTVDEKVEVRLVTVRQYGALTDPAAMSAEDSLLFFFLNLSIRMRLDRLDGIGEVVWAEDPCLDRTWEGFNEAMEIKEKEGVLPPGFRKNFRKKLGRISETALIERFLALLDSYDSQAPDLPVIKQGLASHVARAHGLLKGS